jgi:RNA polymerase sigma-70 factor, ECF subfamily
LTSFCISSTPLSAAQQEDFTRLWTQVQSAVAGYVNTLVGDRRLAEDLLQETALRLLRNYDRYDSARPFLPWALSTAKLCVLGHFRDRSRSKLVFGDDLLERFTQSWAEVVPANPYHLTDLQECLKHLAEPARQMIFMRYFESLDATEIGRRLRREAAAVRMALQRIRIKLRECVDLRSEKST